LIIPCFSQLLVYFETMTTTSTITSKGQTTIPRVVREALGLGPRQKIVYEVQKDGVLIRAAGGALLASAGVLSDGTPALAREDERAAYRSDRAKRYETKA